MKKVCLMNITKKFYCLFAYKLEAYAIEYIVFQQEYSVLQVLVQLLRQSDEVLFWINDKEAFVTAEEFGHDLEHVEVLQRKFDEFQKDMATQEYRIAEVGETADQLVSGAHPETETINMKKREVFEAWARLKSLAIARQEKLFGAHEIQRYLF